AEELPRPALALAEKQEVWNQNRGHFFTYALLFLYTTIAYFRPWELSPAFSWMAPLPYWLALTMLGVFVVSQYMIEGNLTARPREVNLALLLCLLALLSIPQAISPATAWTAFNAVFLKTVIVFVVMVNVLRTKRRLRGMIFLALFAGCIMSAA